jgi:hypothetical protein
MLKRGKSEYNPFENQTFGKHMYVKKEFLTGREICCISYNKNLFLCLL